MPARSEKQVSYWDDLAQLGPDSVIDPRDTRGHKNRYIREIRDRCILSHVNADTETRILDFGCGSGSVVELLERSQHQVIGADISEDQLTLARRRVSSPLVRISGDELPFADDSFDMITTYVVLGHIIDDTHLFDILSDMRRVLRGQGVLLAIEQTARASRLVDRGYKRLRTSDEYASAFERAGFDVVGAQRIRSGHFPPIYLVRAGLLRDGTWGFVRSLDRSYSKSPLAVFDYRDTMFECVAT